MAQLSLLPLIFNLCVSFLAILSQAVLRHKSLCVMGAVFTLIEIYIPYGRFIVLISMILMLSMLALFLLSSHFRLSVFKDFSFRMHSPFLSSLLKGLSLLSCLSIVIFPIAAEAGLGKSNNSQFIRQLYDSLMQQCWGCAAIGYTFDLMIHYGSEGFEAFAKYLRPFLAILFSLWLLTQCALLVLPLPSAPLLATTWRTLMKRAALLVIIFQFLAQPTFLWKWFTEPLLVTTIGIANLIQQEINKTFKDTTKVSAPSVSLLEWVQGVTLTEVAHINDTIEQLFQGQCTAIQNYVSTFQDSQASLSRNSLLCQIESMQKAFTAPLSLGFSQMAQTMVSPTSSFIQRAPFYAGLVVFVTYAAIIVSFILFLMESLLTITLLGLLLPLFTAAFLFPQTAMQGMRGIKHFFQALLTLLILNMITVIGMTLLQKLMLQWGATDAIGSLLNLSENLTSPKLEDAVNHGVTGLTLSHSFFWSLLITGIAIMSMIKRSSAIASYFMGGQDMGAAASATSMAEHHLQNIAGGVTMARMPKKSASKSLSPLSNPYKELLSPKHTH